MRDKGKILLALLLIVLGTYLLLTELGLGLPNWGAVWPLILFAGGIAVLVRFYLNPETDPDRVFFGTAAVLASLVFFFITWGPWTYRSLGIWWPLFVLIAGIALLAQWGAAGFRDWDALFLGLVALCVGGAAVAMTLELLGPNTREILTRLWPVLLILAGLMTLLRGLLAQRSP